jgi:hypothetical protein
VGDDVAPELLTDADWAAELLTLAGLDAVITTSADRVLPLEREMRSWMVQPARTDAQALRRIATSVEEAR